ncbi:MAG: prepilin peptidase [Ignavibacteriae bacterium]|nr:prepilin peptidase [Ignavibacteriota bacterium]
MLLVATIAGILGLALGSFLGSCAYRIPRGISLTGGRSFCPSCASILKWYDLIPILGPALSRWRCRSCGANVPLRYSIIEIITAGYFVILSLTTSWDAGALLTAVFACTLIPLIWTDLEFFLIPNTILIAGSFASVVAVGMLVPAELGSRLLASGGVLVGLYLVGKAASIFVSRQALGLGDVKLAGFIAFHTGPALFLAALWTAAVGALLFVVARRFQHMAPVPVVGSGILHIAGQDAIPFGSFLSGASLVLMIWKEVQPIPFDQWLTLIS